jgi:transcriptional regulator with XRE-family HTH domain
MLKHLDFHEELFPSNVSQYERGARVPSLPVLLAYARAANIYVDALIDDELEIPDRLPSQTKSEGIRRAASRGNKSRKS